MNQHITITIYDPNMSEEQLASRILEYLQGELVERQRQQRRHERRNRILATGDYSPESLRRIFEGVDI